MIDLLILFGRTVMMLVAHDGGSGLGEYLSWLAHVVLLFIKIDNPPHTLLHIYYSNNDLATCDYWNIGPKVSTNARSTQW